MKNFQNEFSTWKNSILNNKKKWFSNFDLFYLLFKIKNDLFPNVLDFEDFNFFSKNEIQTNLYYLNFISNNIHYILNPKFRKLFLLEIIPLTINFDIFSLENLINNSNWMSGDTSIKENGDLFFQGGGYCWMQSIWYIMSKFNSLDFFLQFLSKNTNNLILTTDLDGEYIYYEGDIIFKDKINDNLIDSFYHIYKINNFHFVILKPIKNINYLNLLNDLICLLNESFTYLFTFPLISYVFFLTFNRILSFFSNISYYWIYQIENFFFLEFNLFNKQHLFSLIYLIYELNHQKIENLNFIHNITNHLNLKFLYYRNNSNYIYKLISKLIYSLKIENNDFSTPILFSTNINSWFDFTKIIFINLQNQIFNNLLPFKLIYYNFGPIFYGKIDYHVLSCFYENNYYIILNTNLSKYYYIDDSMILEKNLPFDLIKDIMNDFINGTDNEFIYGDLNLIENNYILNLINDDFFLIFDSNRTIEFLFDHVELKLSNNFDFPIYFNYLSNFEN